MAETQDSEVIKIKKQDLWKYSTFILAAILIIGAFVFFTRGNGTPTANVVAGNAAANNANANAAANNAQQLQGTGDFSFIDNASLYPSVGSTSAKNTVIEFYDFQCPYCAIASGLPAFAQQYATQYSDLMGIEGKLRNLAQNGQIRFVFGTMSFLGAESGTAAEAALCANDQGKFEAMYDAIYTAHDGKEDNGKYTKDNLKKLAAGITGLDQTKFASCLDSGKYTSTVQTLTSNANSAGVSGTPTFVVNGQVMSGSWSQISGVLKTAGVDITKIN